jgi:hypothetical protein
VGTEGDSSMKGLKNGLGGRLYHDSEKPEQFDFNPKIEKNFDDTWHYVWNFENGHRVSVIRYFGNIGDNSIVFEAVVPMEEDILQGLTKTEVNELLLVVKNLPKNERFEK